jgi:hypothetical protein
MGTFLSIDEPNRILFIRLEGLVTDDVLLNRYQQALEWNAVHRYPVCVTDCTGVDASEISAHAIGRIADHPPVVPTEIRRAVVLVTPQNVAFGLARMYEMLTSQTRDKTHVVRTLPEAYQLIGLESLDLQPIIEW